MPVLEGRRGEREPEEPRIARSKTKTGPVTPGRDHPTVCLHLHGDSAVFSCQPVKFGKALAKLLIAPLGP